MRKKRKRKTIVMIARRIPQSDLIDRDTLAEKLKDLSVGIEIETETIERIKIKKDWFL